MRRSRQAPTRRGANTTLVGGSGGDAAGTTTVPVKAAARRQFAAELFVAGVQTSTCVSDTADAMAVRVRDLC